jgi:hypothetical protein
MPFLKSKKKKTSPAKAKTPPAKAKTPPQAPVDRMALIRAARLKRQTDEETEIQDALEFLDARISSFEAKDKKPKHKKSLSSFGFPDDEQFGFSKSTSPKTAQYQVHADEGGGSRRTRRRRHKKIRRTRRKLF